VDGTALDIEAGNDQSKAVNRRSARLHRRQLRRRSYRQARLFHVLQQYGLLPESDPATKEPPGTTPSNQRNQLLIAFDKQLCTEYRSGGRTIFDQLPLYHLRKEALDRKLTPHEVGRVIYHLSQRRGFKSNRKETGKGTESEKEAGQIKEGIAELQKQIDKSEARTLGEYFASLNPHEIGQNVRRRWTARKMYEQEFDQIWKAQSNYYPELLTEELRRKIEPLLFFQRPIASQSHLIGKCELEPNQRRAAWASMRWSSRSRNLLSFNP
jgi:CRISPR-associated endonuclease Csn1